MVKPTIKDVAELSGVSAITVSRALRTPEKVSDSLVERVQNAVEKLWYVPNAAASTLAQNRSNAVIVMIPSLSNNVFADVLRGIEGALKGTNFVTHIGRSYYDKDVEEKALRTFLNPTPVGVILSGGAHTPATERMLSNLDTPVVHIMDVEAQITGHSIGFSNRRAAFEAVMHLFEAGFKKVGFLGAQMGPRSQSRLQGYRDACVSMVQTQEQIVTTNEPSSVAVGAQLLTKLLVRYPDCTAVFCNNDDLAIGVLFECQRRGLRVPTDMGICGFNDLGQTAECYPSITSVFTPLYDIGYFAGKITMDSGRSDTVEKRELATHVVARQSSSIYSA
jgi:LacI family gluconate utilization system Gnt-I transcriptional repressor